MAGTAANFMIDRVRQTGPTFEPRAQYSTKIDALSVSFGMPGVEGMWPLEPGPGSI